MSSSNGGQTPHLTTPASSELLDLPTELLHVIFSSLTIEDVLAARRTCLALASVGIDHMGTEVPLVYHRDKFKALTQIAQHSELSKRMRSLFYLVDRFRFFSYEEYCDKRIRRARNDSDELTDDDEKMPRIMSVRDISTTIFGPEREMRLLERENTHMAKLKKGHDAFLELIKD